MRSLTKCFVLVGLFVVAASSLAYAQGDKPADERLPSAPPGATREEVEQLRREVADLKAAIQRLIQTNQQAAGGARLVEVSAVQPESIANSAEIAQADKQAAQKKGSEAALQAGWNGEHFFVKSADGAFNFQPYGYVQTDYRAYSGDGHPPNTFVIRRGRVGFQGTLGKHYEFAVLGDFAATGGAVMRDIFLNFKPVSAFQIQFGQFKEPFAQEVTTAVTNIDFVERSLASLLYPSAATAFRSPGVLVHGDISGGVFQYWVGAFNGKGIATNNTTNEPEVIGRLRFYPWRKKKDNLLQGFAFGGSIGHGRSRGLSNETSFGGNLPDAAFSFFPSFTIDGPVERYNGEFTWTNGPWAVRAEYNQLNQFRRALSSFAGGVGQNDLPGVVAKAYYGQATYLLTGEKRPENGTPKVKHPFSMGEHGWGAWELKFRYAKIQAKTLDTRFSTGVLPGANAHTDQFTTGINWYPNYWIRYMLDFSVDRAKDPTTANVLPQTFFVVLQRLQFRF